ncbi:MAG: HlyD family secretion protein [Ignavibacteriaceae bacterium]
MKTLQFVIIGLAIVLLSGCGSGDGEFDASGVFEATEVIVSAEANGKILEFNANEGDTLEAGERLGYIDSLQLYLRKLQLTANQRSVQSKRPDIRTQIAATEQQITTAKKEKIRVENLLKANAVNQKQLDDLNAQISLLEKQLAALKSTLTTTNQSLTEESSGLDIQIKQLNDQLQKCQIINPIKGTLLVKYAETGEVTGTGKPLYKVADMENVFLRAYISTGQLTKLKLGQRVKVFADYGEDDYKEYRGEVTWISNKAEFTPKSIQTKDERANLVYAVKIKVKNDGLLKIGMYGEIKISE